MTSSMYVKAVAQVLAQAGTEQLSAPSEASRAAGIDAVRRAIELRRRKRTGLRVLAAAVVLVGVAAGFVLGIRRQPEPTELEVRVAELDGAGATVIASDGTRSAERGSALEPGSQLITAAGAGAVVKLSSGTELALGQATQLEVKSTRSTQRFRLQAGALHADVARLHDGQRFLIGTPDAEVEVHGTAFRVEITDPSRPCAGSRTRVFVDRGVVSVRHGNLTERLVAGARWPADCGPPPEPSPPEPVPLVPAPTRAAPSSTERIAPRRHAVAPPRARASELPSLLSEQNDAFASALRTARSGDPEAAVARLSGFLARYPDGVLAESAAAERLRLLTRLDRARAREAAQRYLERFPSGSAVREAQRVLEPIEP